MEAEELRRLWVEALRSGEYKQGRTYLHSPDTDTYCCLGIACKVYEEHVGPVFTATPRYWGLDAGLPERVKKAFGLQNDLGLYRGNDYKDSLARLNDRGTPFAVIADMIEAHVGTLFEEPTHA